MNATPEQIAAARKLHCDDECEVDDNALVSDPEDGTGYWVQAWVWVPAKDED